MRRAAVTMPEAAPVLRPLLEAVPLRAPAPAREVVRGSTELAGVVLALGPSGALDVMERVLMGLLTSGDGPSADGLIALLQAVSDLHDSLEAGGTR